MPIYEYICSECQEIQEILQKVNENNPQVCPKCNKNNTLSKLVSNSAFHLKGGGWYKDLYSSPKKDDNKVNTAKKTD